MTKLFNFYIFLTATADEEDDDSDDGSSNEDDEDSDENSEEAINDENKDFGLKSLIEDDENKQSQVTSKNQTIYVSCCFFCLAREITFFD